MTHRIPTLAALLLVATACAEPQAEERPAAQPEAAAPAPAPAQVASAAQTSAGKPLIHVWKSPT